MNSKHSKGPFTALPAYNGGKNSHGEHLAFIQTSAEHGMALDVTAARGMARDEFEANVKLFAASPKMLERLIEVHYHLVRLSAVDASAWSLAQAVVVEIRNAGGSVDE